MARNWDALKPSYRRRLIRKGVTREDYESGVTLSAARGHGQTPERPERAYRNEQSRERYREYLGRRQRVYDHVSGVLKEGVYRDVITRLDLERVGELIAHANGHALRVMSNITLPELQQEASMQTPRSLRARYRDGYRSTRSDGLAPAPWWVLMDGRWLNPFWYH